MAYAKLGRDLPSDLLPEQAKDVAAKSIPLLINQAGFGLKTCVALGSKPCPKFVIQTGP